MGLSSNRVKVKVLVTQSCPTLCNPWTIARQAPLSMGFSKPECWSVLPFPSPEDFRTQGLNTDIPYPRQILYHLSHQGRPSYHKMTCFGSFMHFLIWHNI